MCIKLLRGILYLLLIFFIPFYIYPIYVEAEENEPGDVSLPIIMYHSLVKNASGEYAITPDEFEKDLRYLSEHNYQTIGVNDLVEFVYSKKSLPEKPIILTFDDGYYNNYLYALPLLKQYNMKAVISIIGEDSEKWSKHYYEDIKDGHVTWEQINEMAKSGHVEIANHTYAMHGTKNRKGCTRNYGEDIVEYRKILKNDLEMLQTCLVETTGTSPVSFTYPFGRVSPESFEVLKESGLMAAFTTEGGFNQISTNQPNCLYDLKRVNRSLKMSVEKILS